MSHSKSPESSPRQSIRLQGMFRWMVAMVTIAAVVWAARSGVQQLLADPEVWSRISFFRLLLAATGLAAAQLMAGGFWTTVVRALGYPVRIVDGLAAFSMSQLGKYVPGKAMVIVIRAGKIARSGVPLRVAVGSTFVETLMGISVGAAMGLFALAMTIEVPGWMTVTAVCAAVVAGSATVPPVLVHLARWLPGRKTDPGILAGEAGKIGFTWSNWSRGAVIFSVVWLLQGLALYAIISGFSRIDGFDYPVGTGILLSVGAVSLATVIGFVALIPGGLGVRELVIVPVLSVIWPAPDTLAAAILLRLVSIVTEVGLAATLGARGGRRRHFILPDGMDATARNKR